MTAGKNSWPAIQQLVRVKMYIKFSQQANPSATETIAIVIADATDCLVRAVEHLTMTEPEPKVQNHVKRNPNSCNSEPQVEAYELEKQYSFFLSLLL